MRVTLDCSSKSCAACALALVSGFRKQLSRQSDLTYSPAHRKLFSQEQLEAAAVRRRRVIVLLSMSGRLQAFTYLIGKLQFVVVWS